jgi:hypothetical protein
MVPVRYHESFTMLSVAWNDFIALLSHSSFFVLKNFFHSLTEWGIARREGLKD